MPDPTDPLGPLLELPGVAQEVAGARGAIDELLWDRGVARIRPGVIAESALRGAWANAWFEGAQCGLPELRSGAALDGSPIGRLLAASVALHSELPALVPVIGTAPGQALARMHAVAARGFVPDDELGRPRRSGSADDALRLGPLVGAEDVQARLAALGEVLRTSTAPGVLVACVVHAEVASLRPFGWGSGMVARALVRLVLAQRGVDPTMLCAPEIGLRAVGRPRYARALHGYASGSAEAVADALRLVASAIAVGAREPRGWVGQAP